MGQHMRQGLSFRAIGICAHFVAVLSVAAQSSGGSPPVKVPGAEGRVVVPAGRTAAQDAASAMGRNVTAAEIAEAIKGSGLSEAQVRARLQAGGFDPKLADPFFAPGSMSAEMPDAMSLSAFSALGILAPQGVGRDSGLVSLDASAGAAKSIATSKSGVVALQRFGQDLFRTGGWALESSATSAVDPSYRIGVGDNLQIVLTGQVEQAYSVEVRRDGTILIPAVGLVSVAGLTLDAIRVVMATRASTVYSGLADHRTNLDVTVGRIRSLQISVIGEIERPGAYQVSGLSTVFAAVARAGGPTNRGSFRAIEVRRAGRLVSTVDAYDYLLTGNTAADVRLEQGDVVFVPIAQRMIAVGGAVIRPAVYELRNGERFGDLLRYSGGFSPTASLNRLLIDRTLPPEARKPGIERSVVEVVLNGDLKKLDTLSLLPDDAIQVFEVSELRRRSIRIDGAVYAPGVFEWRQGLTLSELLSRAQGFTPWARRDRVKITRQRVARGGYEILTASLSDSGAAPVALNEFDEVLVLDGRLGAERDHVTVTGAVRDPGKRTWAERLTMADVIDLANGLLPWAVRDRVIVARTDSSSGKREVATVDVGSAEGLLYRLQPLDEIVVPDARIENPKEAVVISGSVFQPGSKTFGHGMTLGDAIALSGGLRAEAQVIEISRRREVRSYSSEESTSTVFNVDLVPQNTWKTFLLARDDRVTVRTAPGFRPISSVVLSGAFTYTGVYGLQGDRERLSEVIDRAGGLLPIAYAGSLRVTRAGRPIPVSFGRGARLSEADNIVLQNGDEIRVDALTSVVSVAGGVERQVSVPFRSGWSIDEYIEAAGGFGLQARRDAIVLTRANGEIVRRKRILGVFTSDPEITPGSLINVGVRSTDDKTDWGKNLTITAQIAVTLVSLVISYLAVTK
jgi:polysaccharide export outer membrane protein